jgi:hypothetical protein
MTARLIQTQDDASGQPDGKSNGARLGPKPITLPGSFVCTGNFSFQPSQTSSSYKNSFGTKSMSLWQCAMEADDMRKTLLQRALEQDPHDGEVNRATEGQSATDDNIDFQGRARPLDPPEEDPPPQIGDEQDDRSQTSAYFWPDPPATEAYHGLAGEIVGALEPQSEADPVALLSQILVSFGNAIGRSAHFRVESDKHFLNLFADLVGDTSKARKGTSWGRARWLLEMADSEWTGKRILSGLSSGQGLIWNVRDLVMGRHKVMGKNKRIESIQEYEEDPGELDKRILIVEPEFAAVLKQIEQKENILSAIIRQAWETGNLRTLTTGRQQSPVKATNAHVSIIGHITIEELRRHLSTTEAASGFGNRFLWLCVRRSKCLPEGGQFVDLSLFVSRLTEAISFAKSIGELRRDDDARALWHEVYPSLSEAKPGLAGALTARGEAQTMRLACVYALLDMSIVVKAQHLIAALALWEYCERSVRFIFGDSLGDDVADEILSELRRRQVGMTRTDISAQFDRHQSTGRITRALGTLERFGLASSRPEMDTGGRPAERWFACERTAKKAN